MTQTGGTRKKYAKHKVLIWSGLALWALSALLFALNTGPFQARPLQFTAIIGVALILIGGFLWWRQRERPARD
jgi:undecaprenyl pyrophosphate phosphatase UppP